MMKVTFAHYQSNSRQCLYWNTSDINSIFLLFLQLYNYLYIAVQTKNRLCRLLVSNTSSLSLPQLRKDSKLAHEGDTSD